MSKSDTCVTLANYDYSPESRSFKTPQSGSKRTPRSGSFRTPQSESEITPRSGSFRTPQSESEITPGSGSFRTPQSGSFRTPQSESFKTPQSGSFRTPQSDSFGTPQSRRERTPHSGSFRTSQSKRQRSPSRSERTRQPRNERTSDRFVRHKRSHSDGSEHSSSYGRSEFYSAAKRRRFNSPCMGRRVIENLFPHPTFKSYQLVGDSLLLRFAEQCGGSMARYENGMRFLGLCVSGQTIQDLTARVRSNFAPLGERVILLIGTNNMLQGADVETMKTALTELVDELTKSVKKLVLLTLPPIPKLENSGAFWYKFNQYNRFVTHLSNELDNVFCENISDLFYDRNHECDMDFFESWYDKQQQRPDRIHLNKAGNIRLREKLWSSKALQREIETADEDS